MPTIIILPVLACVFGSLLLAQAGSIGRNRRAAYIAFGLSAAIVAASRLAMGFDIMSASIPLMPGLILNLLTRGVHNSWEDTTGEIITLLPCLVIWFTVIFQFAKLAIKPPARTPPGI